MSFFISFPFLWYAARFAPQGLVCLFGFFSVALSVIYFYCFYEQRVKLCSSSWEVCSEGVTSASTSNKTRGSYPVLLCVVFRCGCPLTPTPPLRSFVCQ